MSNKNKIPTQKKHLSPNTSMNRETRLVHMGREPNSQHGFINPPVYRGSTVLFKTVEDLEANKGPYTYGRKNSPSFTALETALNELEYADRTFLTPSGLSAVTMSILACCKAGDHVLIANSVYYPNRLFCDKQLQRQGVEVTYYDPIDLPALKASIKSNTSLIFLESPGSHSFEIQDIPAITKLAKEHNCKTIVDNTWATPLFLNPLKLGADIVVHAATKYIVGHSDSLLGTISCQAGVAQAVENSIYHHGICAGPDDVNLGLRGLRTLSTRLRIHEAAALHIAQWLEDQEPVKQVLHPALSSHPQHDLWKRDFTGSTGLFGVILKTQNKQALSAMMNGFRLFSMGWSWGGYESLAVPSYPNHHRTNPPWEEDGQLIRLHIGLENLDDLKADLAEGFARWQS